MKQTTSKLAIALAMAATLALVGCESDDDGGSDSSPADQQTSVVGTWAGPLTGPGGSPTVQGTIVFNANQTYTVSTPLGGATGTYTVSGNTVTMVGTGDNGRSGTTVMQVNGQAMAIVSHYEGITGTLTKQ